MAGSEARGRNDNADFSLEAYAKALPLAIFE